MVQPKKKFCHLLTNLIPNSLDLHLFSKHKLRAHHHKARVFLSNLFFLCSSIKHCVVLRNICIYTKPLKLTQNDTVYMPDQYVALYFCHKTALKIEKTRNMHINLACRRVVIQQYIQNLKGSQWQLNRTSLMC